MGVYVGGLVRLLRLFGVLARNRQSALGLSGRTISAHGQPNRMCTIPPRQQLSSPTWLAIRARRVARARMRNRIRIIARVLQPPHPCNTKRERQLIHPKTINRRDSLIYFASSHFEEDGRKKEQQKHQQPEGGFERGCFDVQWGRRRPFSFDENSGLAARVDRRLLF